jgi:hypothetical protein
VNEYRSKLAALGPGPKIGISWRGGLPGTRRALRSISPADLHALRVSPNVHWISLQYGDVGDDVQTINQRGDVHVHHWPDIIADQDRLAALICATDLTLSVQTAAAHLSGALGKPTWVLVPAIAEWRYGADGDSMPWYPAARLWRQQAGEPWVALLDRVSGALATHIASVIARG